MSGQAIPSRPPNLLVVALQVLGQVEVEDEAHVGFVDAHAKGNRGYDDADIVAGESALISLPGFIVEAGVVG